jgi:hypothetical protein
MPWPITWTIWVYIICIVGTVAVVIYKEIQEKKTKGSGTE